MDTLDNLDILDYLRSRCRKRKSYKKRRNPFEDYDEDEFRLKYRFSKENTKKLIKLVEDDLKGKGKRNGGSIPSHIQVLAALRCWGQNQIQDDCAKYHGFTQSTMSRICRKVALAFANKAKHIIKMPKTYEEQVLIIEKFKTIAGLCDVIGAIGCTHIRIQAMAGDDAQLLVNRKGYISLNVQIVCDASLKIMDITVDCRGNTDDSMVFDNSKVKKRFEGDEFIGRLLGDGGYKCNNYLFTPVRHPKTHKEEIFNTVHIKTRNAVEILFGVWKSRFRVLMEKMRISRQNVKVLIVALAVIHNLSIIYEEQDFDEYGTYYPNSETSTFEEDTENENISRKLYIQRNF